MIRETSLAMPGGWFSALLLFLTDLKPFSKALIFAEGLDIISTYIGQLVFSQITEANPLPYLTGGMGGTMLLKVLAVALVILILERYRGWPKLVWIVPAVAALPVLWNVMIISAEIWL